MPIVGIKLPEKYAGDFPHILCGADAGGIGQQFVKATFIDGAPAMKVYTTEASEGGMRRQFIPAHPEENPSMNDNDG